MGEIPLLFCFEAKFSHPNLLGLQDFPQFVELPGELDRPLVNVPAGEFFGGGWGVRRYCLLLFCHLGLGLRCRR